MPNETKSCPQVTFPDAGAPEWTETVRDLDPNVNRLSRGGRVHARAGITSSSLPVERALRSWPPPRRG